MGGGRDRVLYPQYISGIVHGFQEEDCPEPENTSTPVLYTRVLPSLLPDHEPDPQREQPAGLFGLSLLYHTRPFQQTLGRADPRLHQRDGAGALTVTYCIAYLALPFSKRLLRLSGGFPFQILSR